MSVVMEPPVGGQDTGILPPLEMGDHLDRATFHARYEAMPPGIKAELIDGVVFMPSPAKSNHGAFSSLVNTWLGVYAAGTPGVRALDNASVILSETSELQPDAALVIQPQCGGQSGPDTNDWMVGAPELVVEVSSSSASYDLHRKRRVYEAAGVREYLVVQLQPRALTWFVLRQDRYQEIAVDADGLMRSEVFPGLWLEPQKLLREDGAGVLAALQQGLASEQHAELVARLEGLSA